MARFVSFNGQTLFKPGGLTRINANALTPIGLSATGIVGLIGEADGGAPDEMITIDDPALAASIFGTGPLADAVRIAFDASNDPRIPGSAFRCVCYKVNQSLQSGTHLPGDGVLLAETTMAGSTTTVVNGTVAAQTVNQHAGRWLLFSGEKRRIVSNTASPNPQYTVSPGFSSAPGNPVSFSILDDQIILTSVDYGVKQNQLSVEFEAGIGTDTFVVTLALNETVEQSPDLGGTPQLYLKYVGGPIPANGSGTITAATTSTITLNVAAAPVLNAWAAMVLQFADGKQRLITGNTAADPTVITLDAAHVLTTAEAAAVVGSAAVVRDVTSATASFVGASGVATTLTSTVAPTADNLSLTLGTQTLRQFVDYINANTNYRADYPDGLNPDTTLMSSFDFGTRATAVDVRFDDAIAPATKGTFRRDLQIAVDWINEFSSLATAARASVGATEGSEIPAFTGGAAAVPQDLPTFFIGGSRGVSSNSNWQTAFDAFLEVRVNHIVPLIAEDLTNEGNGSTATFASVAAQLSDHVSQCRGIAKSERGGYIGGDLTKDELLTQAAQLNNTDVQLMGQKLTTLDSSGTLVEQPEWSSAVNAAGMRSGAPEVGEPLTFKFMKTTALSQDSSWSPRSRTDINQLIQGGVMFAEQVVGKGFRWVRDLTTYLIDDNIAFMDGNTRDAVRFVAYDLRTFLEDQFTGVKAKPANVANIREQTAAKLQLYREDSIIVDSLDPETLTTTIPGWRNLRVFINGNVATVRVEIFPVTGIVFQLNDIYLQLPRLAA